LRITILTIGSRGDVQPYIALGIGLQRAGHTVRFATHAIFESWVRSYGLDFALVRFNPQDIVNRPEAQKSKANIVRFMRAVRRIVGPQFHAVFEDFWQASQGAEAIIGSLAAFGAYDCAEKLHVPLIMGLLQPLIPTRAFPSFFSPPMPNLGGTYNRLTHLLLEQLLWHNVRSWVTHWRKAKLQLPPPSFTGPYSKMRAERVPHILGCSPAVIPKPADWAYWHYVSGYWFLDPPADWHPPAALEQFLRAGPPPIYVGFGSMRDERPEVLTQIVVDALDRTGQRGILAAGWAGLGGTTLPETIFQIESIPHRWLFPRMAAVVHHGGAGTTGAGLRSGIPSIIIPFGGDQYHWARVVVKLGVAPEAPSVNRLTADSLASAIGCAINDQDLRARAIELGGMISAEDGVSRATDIVDRHIQSEG
jgi:sterol 3beta-glucosyltransferase